MRRALFVALFLACTFRGWAAPCDPEQVNLLKLRLAHKEELLASKKNLEAQKPAITAKVDALKPLIEAFETASAKYTKETKSTDPVYGDILKAFDAMRAGAEAAQQTYMTLTKTKSGRALGVVGNYTVLFEDEEIDLEAAETAHNAVEKFTHEKVWSLERVKADCEKDRKLGEDIKKAVDELIKVTETAAIKANAKIITQMRDQTIADCHEEVDKLLSTDPAFKDQRANAVRDDLVAQREKADGKAMTPGDYFPEDATDKGTAQASNDGRKITVSPGGNLWEIARQLIGRKSSPQALAALVKKMQSVVKTAKGKSRTNSSTELMPGDTIDLSELPA